MFKNDRMSVNDAEYSDCLTIFKTTLNEERARELILQKRGVISDETDKQPNIRIGSGYSVVPLSVPSGYLRN